MALSKGFELATLGSGLDVNQSTGEVVTISMDTDVVSEGSSNLYFTNERVDDRVADLLVGGSNITVTYDDTAGTLTIAGQSGYSDSDVNAFLAGGTAGNIVTTGYIAGPATLTIDPAGVGDNTGKVVIAGDLQVDGTQTTINSTTLDVDDLNITVASGAADSAAANGAGLTVDGAGANITYTHATTSWDFNKPVSVTGNIAVSGTVDGVDIATRDGILTTTTTTANAALPKAGGTMTGDILYNDNVKAKFGAGSDLEIYHDGSNSYIKDGGTGGLFIQGSNTIVLEDPDGNNMIYAQDGGGVSLYHNASIRLSTTPWGANVDGSITVTGTVDGRDMVIDGNKLDGIEASADVTDTANVTSAGALMDSEVTNLAQVKAFDSSDYATAAQGTTADAALPKAGGVVTGNIDISGTNAIRHNGDTDTFIQFHADDQWRVATGGVERLEINNTTMTVANTLSMNGHNIDMNNMDIVGVDQIVHEGDSNTYIRFHAADQFQVVTGGTERLEVTNSGANVTGNITVSGTVDGRDVSTDGTKLDTIATNANNYSHPNHSGEVTSTGDGATVIASDVVDADNLKVTGNGSNTQFLRSDGDGTFTWATPVDTNTVYTHPNHTGEVTSTGDGATVIANNVVDEANLKVSNAPTNGYFLSAQSGNAGGLTWATVPAGYTDSDVQTYISGNRTYGNITTTGYIAGPATLTIDPAGVGDNTGKVVIAGDLQIDGTTTTINSTVLTVDDKNITLASGAADAAAANGAGITVDGASATIEYNSTHDEWHLSKGIKAVDYSVGDGTKVIDSSKRGYFVNLQNSSPISFLNGTNGVSGSGAQGINVRHVYAGTSYASSTAGAGDIEAKSNFKIAGNVVIDSSRNITSGNVDVTGNITVSGTVDGVDIAARDAILTSTTTTANAALPKAGGTMTGDLKIYKAEPIITLQRSDNTLLPGISWQGSGGSEAASIKMDGTGGMTNSLVMSTYNGSTMTERLRLVTAAAGGISVTGNIAVSGTVDGRDVAVDGSKLDGIETGATADQTAAQLLTAIKTVDGSGSGLDADLLDGISSGSFLRNDASNTISTYTNRTTFYSNTNAAVTNSHQSSLEVFSNGAGNDAFMEFHVGGDYATYFGLDGDTNDLFVGGWSKGAQRYKMWHQGNDGSGSGLDADLLDGQQGSYYQKKTTVQDAAPSGATGDLWYESDSGSFYVYYGGAWVDVAPGVETNTNLQINSLGVGTAASGTAGEIRATNDVTAYYSDARLKNFESTIDGALDKVKQLNGYYFTENETAKELGYDNDKRQVGVSAQEVEAVLPEIVTEAPISDEYLTVKYEKLAPLFIEAIKEIDEKYQAKQDQQQAQIDTLMEEINRLKGN